MFKKILVTGIISTGLLVTSPLMARGNQSNNHGHSNGQQAHQQCLSGNRVNVRQNNQKRRIKQGIRKGQLVKWEAKVLKRQQKKIRKLEKRLRKSGHCLTRAEVKKLQRKLNRASNKISQLRHNRIRVHRHNFY